MDICTHLNTFWVGLSAKNLVQNSCYGAISGTMKVFAVVYVLVETFVSWPLKPPTCTSWVCQASPPTPRRPVRWVLWGRSLALRILKALLPCVYLTNQI